MNILGVGPIFERGRIWLMEFIYILILYNILANLVKNMMYF